MCCRVLIVLAFVPLGVGLAGLMVDGRTTWWRRIGFVGCLTWSAATVNFLIGMLQLPWGPCR
jgi:hypothetical protein